MAIIIKKSNEIKNIIRLLNSIMNTVYLTYQGKVLYFEGMDIYSKVYIKIEYYDIIDDSNQSLYNSNNSKFSLNLNNFNKILKFSNYKSDIELIFKNNLNINIYNTNIIKKFIIPIDKNPSNLNILFEYKNKIELDSKKFYEICNTFKDVSGTIKFNIDGNIIRLSSECYSYKGEVKFKIDKKQKKYITKLNTNILLNILKLYKLSHIVIIEYEVDKPLKVSFKNKEFNFLSYISE
jgi:hypothetical protein